MGEFDNKDSKQCCGEYCRNLNPDEERNIILEVLKDSIALHFENLKGQAYEEFRTSMVSDVETAKYTARHFNSMNMINAQENDRRYLISAAWWREWCDYTNFDLSQLQLKNSSAASPGIKRKSNASNQNASPQQLNKSDAQADQIIAL